MVTYVGGGATSTDNVASKTLPFPAGVLAGDIAVVFWGRLNTGTVATDPTSVGFASAKVTTKGSLTRSVYTKVCTGSESLSLVTVAVAANERHTATLVVYRDATLGTIQELSETATDLSHDCPPVTTTKANEPVLIAVSERISSGTASYTVPSGWTKRQEHASVGSGGTTTAVADDLPSTPTRAAGTVVTPGPWVGSGTATPNVVTTAVSLIPAGAVAVSADAALAVTATASAGVDKVAPVAASLVVSATASALANVASGSGPTTLVTYRLNGVAAGALTTASVGTGDTTPTAVNGTGLTVDSSGTRPPRIKATGTTASTVRFNHTGGVQFAGRKYFEFAALPSSGMGIVQGVTGAALVYRLAISATGNLRVEKFGGGTVATSATTLAPNTLYRLAWTAAIGTTGQVVATVYVGESTTVAATVTASSDYGTANVDGHWFGLTGAVVSGPTVYLDDLALTNGSTPPGAIGAADPIYWRSGAYVSPTTPTELRSVGIWRGRPMALAQVYQFGTWAQIEAPTALLTWAGTEFAGAGMLLSSSVVPSTDATATYEAAAAGTYNFHYDALGAYLVANGFGNCYIRANHEYNGDFSAWSTNPSRTNATSIARSGTVDETNNLRLALQNFVTRLRAQGWTGKLVLSPANGRLLTQPDFLLAYPGPSYCAVLGPDFYDRWFGFPDVTVGGTTVAADRWNHNLTGGGTGRRGVTEMTDFCKAGASRLDDSGNPTTATAAITFAVSEHGMWFTKASDPNDGGGGDDPDYFDLFYGFLEGLQAAKGVSVEYDCLFNNNGTDNVDHQLFPQDWVADPVNEFNFTNAAARYQALLTAPNVTITGASLDVAATVTSASVAITRPIAGALLVTATASAGLQQVQAMAASLVVTATASAVVSGSLIQMVGNPVGGSAMGIDILLTFDIPPATDDVTVLIGGHYSQGVAGPATPGYTVAYYNNTSEPYFGMWFKRQPLVPDVDVTARGSGDALDAAAYVAYVLRGVDPTTPLDFVTAGIPGLDPAARTVATPGTVVIAATGMSRSLDDTPGVISGYINTVVEAG